MKKGGPLCYFCNKNHVPSLCRTYPDGISRQKSLENQGKCIKCLKIGHQNGDNFCEKHHIVCRTCQQSHVKAVCPILYPKKDTPPKILRARRRSLIRAQKKKDFQEPENKHEQLTSTKAPCQENWSDF